MKIQIIEHNGTTEYAVIPFSEWQQIVDRLEELDDIADARQVSAALAASEETFSHEFSKRLVSGESGRYSKKATHNGRLFCSSLLIASHPTPNKPDHGGRERQI